MWSVHIEIDCGMFYVFYDYDAVNDQYICCDEHYTFGM